MEENKLEENLMALLKQIPKIDTGNRFILGIDGLSRSGKTTLSNMLCKNLKEELKTPIYLFHIDEHIVEREKRYNTGHEEWYEYYYIQWDIDWLSQNFFTNLRFSNQFSLPFYDNESDRHSLQNIILPNDCIIIIEGVFLQRKEWRNYYDFLVYLDCQRDSRFLRESDRTQNDIKKLENRYWKAEEFYVKSVVPMKNADLVLKG
jgi:uridine kinase